MKHIATFCLAALCAVPLAAQQAPAGAVSAPADASRPALGTRVGGSQADADFRAVIQKSGEEYRQKRAECRKQPSGDQRNGCLKDAKATLDKERADAKAAHDEALRAARAERAAGRAASR